MAITVAAPALIYVKWTCRRCGHNHGMARTTLPFDFSGSPEMRAVMVDQLKQKLVRVHQAKQGCIAVSQDFVITPCNPHGDISA